MLITVLSTGCTRAQTEQPVVTTVNTSLPSWYTHTPENDVRYIYGIGRADSRKHAISEALQDAVATLNVAVSSSAHYRTTVTNNQGSETINTSAKQELGIIVEQVQLNNYKLLEHQTYGQEELVLIQIDKHQLYTKLYDEIIRSIEILDIQLQQKEDALEKILIYRQTLNRLRVQLSAEALLKSLNPAYDGKVFKTAYKKSPMHIIYLLKINCLNLNSMTQPMAIQTPYDKGYCKMASNSRTVHTTTILYVLML